MEGVDGSIGTPILTHHVLAEYPRLAMSIGHESQYVYYTYTYIYNYTWMNTYAHIQTYNIYIYILYIIIHNNT